MAGFDLHLLRHGALVTPGLLMGRTDGVPSEAGLAACMARAEGLAVEAVVHSGLARSEAPAHMLAAAHGVPLTCDPRWRELDFGAWDGLATESIDRDSLGRFYDDPDAHAPPGGEPWSALVERVGAAVAELPARTVLVVTHGGAMRAALAHLCGFAQRQLWAFDLPYAALLSLRVWPGEGGAAQIRGLRS
ncbi:histidine phosphatase family protein [Sphingobium sufflavum]|uniref:histidine phosphatase family protein n=1 Tax=Sphingobium sufflavum TaxID=1129547 RepID=UPI001F295CFC|nr:histidine phosphatase family protein [Sphingobium sufflavum]MCE7795472.1 histidine phosphatase family protein [Sphingobium sufflavum]